MRRPDGDYEPLSLVGVALLDPERAVASSGHLQESHRARWMREL